MKTLGLLLVATLSVARAAPDSPPASQPSPATELHDPFVEAERQSQSWLEFSGAVVRGWQLSIRLSTNTFQIGRPISAVVVFKNAATNSLRLHVSTPGVPYMFTPTVLDEAGGVIAMNDEARERLEHGHADFALFRDVPPGGRLAFPFELQHFYGLARPGTYKLQAMARWLPGNAQGNPGSSENTVPVKSGAAPITLIAAAHPPIGPHSP